ncbi:MAG: aminoacyl-histidine dipeptidase [Bacteroidaceae bacterium]|nr:aminoacyl-histidine dipeptidase [Bacteroidaceae bacterium]
MELKPKAVFDYFAEINKVPRPSKHEEKMIAYLQDFAQKNQLAFKTDEAGNVLIAKPATPGMEDRETVILQGHMDMVCEKTSDRVIDFANDPIEAYIDGEWMRAKGTTLGADDGIGVALAMAVLTDTTIKHGPIECLFTRDEETGLTGAFAIQPGFMTGKYLINLDSEDEGEIFIGCAGGVNTEIEFEYYAESIPEGYTAVKVVVDKLTGGHSGDDINKNRANANKLLARFLYQVNNKYDLFLCSIDGGNLHNAIPRHAEAVIAIPDTLKHEIRSDFNIFAAEIQDEYHTTEPNAEFTMESCELPDTAIDNITASNLIASLNAVHNGVYEWSQDIPQFVETSSNLASIKMPEEGKIKIVTSQRSSTKSQLDCVCNVVASAFSLAGADVLINEGYPGWKPNPNSKLLQLTVEKYKELFNKEPKVRAIHAGLECGLFSEKYPGLDMVSFGPTLRGVHSPDEKLLIPTVEMVWRHLVAIIENIPTK